MGHATKRPLGREAPAADVIGPHPSNIILRLVFHAFMLPTYIPVCHDGERERTLYVAHQLLIDAVRGDLKIERQFGGK